MAAFNVHEPLIQAAVIEAAARMSAARQTTVEEVATMARELLELLTDRPTQAPFAPMR